MNDEDGGSEGGGGGAVDDATMVGWCNCSACIAEGRCHRPPGDGDGKGDGGVEVTRLRILTADGPGFEVIRSMIESAAEAYTARTDGAVEIDLVGVKTLPDLNDEIEADARQGTAFYDGYVSNPRVVGSAVLHGGFLDLTPHVLDDMTLDWLDVLLAFREVIATYDGRIYMVPLDGDVHSLFYRRDVLEEFGLKVPRTWDEYAEVARAVHSRVYEGKELIGSCVGRERSCGIGAYWTNLVLSSITQTGGTSSGHLFDTKDLSPLLGEALVEAIRQLEEHVKYGAPDEFERCGGGGATSVNIVPMLDGRCVLTYNWGDNFKIHLSEGSQVGGLIGVAPTPGSTRVLDRETGRLVPCDPDRCRHGEALRGGDDNDGSSDDGSGTGAEGEEEATWVNRAPYLAFGGWAGAVSSQMSERRRKLTMDFLFFMSGREQSSLGVIPNATGPPDSFNGQDPFRSSHLDVEEWVAKGYPEEGAERYRETIVKSTRSKNVAVDVRFPEADRIERALGEEVHDYLNRTRNGTLPEDEEARARERRAVANRVESEWRKIIADFDATRPAGTAPLLEQYQRSLGVFTQDLNQIDDVRWFGWLLASIAVATSLFFAVWVCRNWKERVIRASQPVFLLMICAGSLVMGAAIFPLGIDDSIASVDGCSIACMAWPWLFTCGFTFSFAALFSKIWRINKIFHNPQFRRITVKEKDVLKPFFVMFLANIIVLLAWQLVDPLKWTRESKNKLSSYGKCVATNSSTASTVFISILAAVNFLALILANFQAFRARKIDDEFSESKYIAISLGSILQLAVIALPLTFLIQDSPPARYFVYSSIAFVISMSLQLLIFVPKMLLVKKKRKKRMEKERKKLERKEAGALDEEQDSSTDASNCEGIRITKAPSMLLKDAATVQLAEQSERIKDLKRKLIEQGINASRIFDEVGLSVSDTDDESVQPGVWDGKYSLNMAVEKETELPTVGENAPITQEDIER